MYHQWHQYPLKIGLEFVLEKKYYYKLNIFGFIHILPDGFVKKKCMVDLVIALNISKCKFLEALEQTDTNIADIMTVITTNKMVRRAKIAIQICLEFNHDFNEKIEPTVILDKLLFADSTVTL